MMVMAIGIPLKMLQKQINDIEKNYFLLPIKCLLNLPIHALNSPTFSLLTIIPLFSGFRFSYAIQVFPPSRKLE